MSSLHWAWANLSLLSFDIITFLRCVCVCFFIVIQLVTISDHLIFSIEYEMDTYRYNDNTEEHQGFSSYPSMCNLWKCDLAYNSNNNNEKNGNKNNNNDKSINY